METLRIMFDIDKLNIYWTNETEKALFGATLEERYANYVKATEEVNEEAMSFEHFSSLAKSSLDSKLLQLEQEILLHPRNAHHLLMPIVDDIFSKKVYTEMTNLGTIEEEPKGYFFSVLPHVNVRKSVIFTKGKSGVGVVALDITGHSTSQIDNVELRDRFLASDGNVYSTMLRFDGMQTNYTLGNYTNEDQKFISEVLSQLLTTQVDNVKDPKAVKMNITMQTLGIVGYLTRRGVSTSKIIKLINQPIIKDYLRQQIINESLSNKAAKQELTKSRLIAKVLKDNNINKLTELDDSWTFTEEELTEGLSGKDKSFQAKMLYYFLELLEQTKAFSNYSTYQNADTKGLKNRQSVEEVILKAQQVRTSQIVSTQTFTRVNTTGVISPFTQARNMYDDIYRRFYFTVNSPYYKPLLAFKEAVTSLQKTANRKEKARKQIEEDFVLFFVHKFVLNEADIMDRLFGKNGNISVAERVRTLQQRLPGNLALKAFFPMLKNTIDPVDGEFIDSLRLFERELLTMDANDLINSMRELGEIDPELYYDIVHLLFFQSGISNSPYNYFKAIPVAKSGSIAPAYEFAYQEILNQAIENADRLVQTEDQAREVVNEFSKLFQLNNPQFLRSRSFNGYPLDYTTSYIKGKPVIIEVESGQSVTALGNSAIKRYNISTSPVLEYSRTIIIPEEITNTSDIDKIVNNIDEAIINKNIAEQIIGILNILKSGEDLYNPDSISRQELNKYNRLLYGDLGNISSSITGTYTKQMITSGKEFNSKEKPASYFKTALESRFPIIKFMTSYLNELNKTLANIPNSQSLEDIIFKGSDLIADLQYDKSISTGALISELYKDFINTNTIYQGSDILAFIGESEYYNALVPELLKFNQEFKFQLFDNDFDYIEDIGKLTGFSISDKVDYLYKNSNGSYLGGKVNKIWLGRKSRQKTLIHELIHATIQQEYNNRGEFAKKINDLFEIADSAYNKIQGNNPTPYGFYSPTEFLAEALSNPEFMQILNEIPYNDGKSVWTYFMDLVSKFINSTLGIEFKRGSVLEQVVRLSEQVINNKAEINKHASVSEFTIGSEVLNNFETYFPQFSYFNQEQRNQVAKMVEEGKIQLKCEF